MRSERTVVNTDPHRYWVSNESHAGGLVVPPVGSVLAIAVLEGALFPLAVLPLLYTLDTSRRDSALICGAVLVVLGGIVPLIVVPSLPVFLRVASAWEIFFQKFPVGVVAAVLLGPWPRPPLPAGAR